MFADVAQAIEEFRSLPANWDGEGAPVVDATAVDVALELLVSIAGMAPRQGARWEDPQVSPDVDGGVDLLWHQGGSWALLTVPVGADSQIQVTSQLPGFVARSRWASLAEAASAACSLFLPLEMVAPR